MAALFHLLGIKMRFRSLHLMRKRIARNMYFHRHASTSKLPFQQWSWRGGLDGIFGLQLDKNAIARWSWCFEGLKVGFGLQSDEKDTWSGNGGSRGVLLFSCYAIKLSQSEKPLRLSLTKKLESVKKREMQRPIAHQSNGA